MVVTACALIAAFNEEQHVAAVVGATARYVDHIVVVDDGSSDATAARARDAGAEVVQHPRNLGKGSAVRTGLAHLLPRTACSHVLFIDADMQHDPEEIPALLARAENGVGDFVIGEREFCRTTMPKARFYSNVFGSAIMSSLIAVRVRDSQSGFRLVRAEWLRAVRLTGRGYEIESEMLIKLARAGAVIEGVPVRRLTYEDVRSKIRPFRDTFRTCMLSLKYRYLDGQA
jgi:glycosyltransferase involved in cell wall biosynthesis